MRTACLVEKGGDDGESSLETCEKRQVKEMEEMDVGACGDWRLAQGWGHASMAETDRMDHSVRSPMGRQCHNLKLHSTLPDSLEPCSTKYYLSESGQRNVFSK